MGPAPLGFVYFVGIKLAGYSAAAIVAKKYYSDTKQTAFAIGAARTAIGIGAGVAYGLLWWLVADKIFHAVNPSPVLYLAGLMPVRIGEWLWLVHLFYDKRLSDAQKVFRFAAAGTAWSYCLDAIGIGAALVIPGGIWVC